MKGHALVPAFLVSVSMADPHRLPDIQFPDGGKGGMVLLVPAVSLGLGYSNEPVGKVADVVVSPIHLSWGSDWLSLYGTVGERFALGEHIRRGAVVEVGLAVQRHFDFGYVAGLSSGKVLHEARLSYSLGWKGRARRTP